MSLSVISPLVHRKVLRGETRIWLLNDILLPFAGPLLLLPLALRFAPPENATRLYALLFLAVFMGFRSEEHTSELQSLMHISYAVFCLQKKNTSSINYYTPFIQTNTQLQHYHIQP